MRNGYRDFTIADAFEKKTHWAMKWMTVEIAKLSAVHALPTLSAHAPITYSIYPLIKWVI